MKKAMMMAAMVGVLGTGIAGAQTWPTENGQYTLNACYGTKDGIQCDLTYNLSKVQTLDLDVDYQDFSAFTNDGNKVSPQISLAGKDWSQYPSNLKVYNGTPVKVSLLFNIPANTNSLASIAIGDANVKNIPVRPFGTAAPAPIMTSAPASAQAVNISGNWNATLTNCRQSAPGVVVCTATLKK